MNEIPAIFWMVIIAGLSAIFALILYYVAMLLRETTGAVEDARGVIQKTDAIVGDVTEVSGALKGTVTMLTGTVDKIHDSLLKPFRNLAETAGVYLGAMMPKGKEERDVRTQTKEEA